MRFTLITAIALMALTISPVRAASNVSLDFNGGAGGVADTGFEGVYNLDPAGFSLSGGQLVMQTLPGDIWGRYEPVADPDDAKNVFYTNLDADPLGGTVVDAKITVRGLSQGYHGGGIWFGTDEDHYLRLGVINFAHAGSIVAEALRENEDLWGNHGGPGGDITSSDSGMLAPSPLAGPLDVYLRLVREGSTARAYVSTDGVNYNWIANRTFDAIATGPASGATVEGPFKVGAYAFGGGNPPATVAFDYFTARAIAPIPEPGSLMLLLGGAPVALAALRRRAR